VSAYLSSEIQIRFVINILYCSHLSDTLNIFVKQGKMRVLENLEPIIELLCISAFLSSRIQIQTHTRQYVVKGKGKVVPVLN
jgi:hypothetical protein